MFVLAILAPTTIVITAFFTAIMVGLHQAHPTDLALQRSTCLAVFASRVVGLHVRSTSAHERTGLSDRYRVVR